MELTAWVLYQGLHAMQTITSCPSHQHASNQTEDTTECGLCTEAGHRDEGQNSTTTLLLAAKSLVILSL